MMWYLYGSIIFWACGIIFFVRKFISDEVDSLFLFMTTMALTFFSIVWPIPAVASIVYFTSLYFKNKKQDKEKNK